jgi:hypothetical protein
LIPDLKRGDVYDFKQDFMIQMTKRLRWIITAAILLLIILWMTTGQQRKPINPVRPGKTTPMPDDNRVKGKIQVDKRWT